MTAPGREEAAGEEDGAAQLTHGIASAARSQSMPLVLVGVAGAALAFVGLAAQVNGGSTRGVDVAILRWIRATTGGDAATGGLRSLMLDFTALGDTGTLTVFTVLVTGYMLVSRRWRLALSVVAAIAGGATLVVLLKGLFNRARPDVVTHLADFHNASFPSGHAANSAVVYLTLAVLLARSERAHATRIYLVAVGVAMTLAIGTSRLYLGVHWPTDVLGGWIVGGSWAALTGLLVRHAQHAHRIEDPREPA